jgi:hypothetical protein
MKETRAQRQMRLAHELDERRQKQIGLQIDAINRLMYVNSGLMLFLYDEGLEDKWAAKREDIIERLTDHAGPCGICGAPNDHLGVPHSVATGDGRTRADIADVQ